MTPIGAADPYDYITNPGPFTVFLWRCAGADPQLLRRSPHSDRVKFQGLGGIVLATAILAFVSGWYALYTVFGPKASSAVHDVPMDWPWAAACAGGAFVWALIIFNIDRFIVSSTGKGDGTEAWLTTGELVNALPRLAMATVIGACISAPLEIRILKTEIDSELSKRQMARRAEYDALTEAQVDKTIADVQARIDSSQKRLDARPLEYEKRRAEINEQRRRIEDEAEGRGGSGTPGRGPAYLVKKANLDRLEQELEQWKKDVTAQDEPLKVEIDRQKKELEKIGANVDREKADNALQAAALDGLMERIHISHEIGGVVPIAILLLLLFVEVCPIFFKMQLVTGCYDHLRDNQKYMALARYGVEETAVVVGKRWFGLGDKIELKIRSHQAEALLAAEQERLKTELELTRAVHEEFRKREALRIAENPEKYLKPRPELDG